MQPRRRNQRILEISYANAAIPALRRINKITQKREDFRFLTQKKVEKKRGLPIIIPLNPMAINKPSNAGKGFTTKLRKKLLEAWRGKPLTDTDPLNSMTGQMQNLLEQPEKTNSNARHLNYYGPPFKSHMMLGMPGKNGSNSLTYNYLPAGTRPVNSVNAMRCQRPRQSGSQLNSAKSINGPRIYRNINNTLGKSYDQLAKFYQNEWQKFVFPGDAAYNRMRWEVRRRIFGT